MLFKFSVGRPPMISIIIEYKPVFTIMPESRLFMPILVWRKAVTNPDRIPAAIAASMDRNGFPEAMATTAPTAAPNAKQPSVERSHILSME